MKRPKSERRVEALERAYASTYENSRAKRTGSQTKEEWEACKIKELARLEDRVNGRTSRG
jgi:hypothetical protein